MPIDGPVDVLEVGCGTGAFWKENLSRLAEGSTLTLTDLTEAMIEKTRANVEAPFIRYETVEIEKLPYDDDSFDIVNAHHVIYHTEDKAKAFEQIKRVLRPEGYLTITTNSERHMRNVYDIGRQLDPNFPTDRIIDSFTEEIADDMLLEHFSEIEKHIQKDLLKGVVGGAADMVYDRGAVIGEIDAVNIRHQHPAPRFVTKFGHEGIQNQGDQCAVAADGDGLVQVRLANRAKGGQGTFLGFADGFAARQAEIKILPHFQARRFDVVNRLIRQILFPKVDDDANRHSK